MKTNGVMKGLIIIMALLTTYMFCAGQTSALTQMDINSRNDPCLLFYDLDDETGQEELSVTISSNLTIGKNNLTYSTMEWEDPDIPGDQYIGWLGEPYFVIQSGPDWYISKVLIDEDEDDVRTLNEGQSLTLPEGFVLTATEIEGFGGKANFIVTQDGEPVGSIVVNQGEQFKYETDLNKNGEDDNWVLRFNVEGVFEGVYIYFVTINDTDMISPDVLSGSDISDIGEDYFVNTAFPSTIKIENDNNIKLKIDGVTGILDDRFGIRVNKPGTMAAISKDIEVIGQNEFYEILCAINTTTENEYFTFSANSYDNPCLLYFDLDDENGKEEITVIAGVSSGDQLEIHMNNLAYITMEWEDPDIPGDHYIGWLGEPYFVIQSGREWYISELLVDEDDDDTHLLRVGESLTLPAGFAITPLEIDVDGAEAWFSVTQDGEEVESSVVDAKTMFEYEADLNESGEDDNWVLRFNLETVFAGMNTNLVKINKTQLLDPDVLKVESVSDDIIEGYSVDTAIPSTIKIENDNYIILIKDGYTSILDDRFGIRVNKQGTMAALSRLITEPGIYELICAVEYLDDIDSPPASVTNLHNITYAPTYINWTWTDPVDADFAGVMVYLDQVFKTNVSKGVQYYNATGLNSSTTYTISTKTVDSTGNINQTPVDNTSTTAPPLDIEPPAGVTNLQNVSYAPTYINWTWTDPVDADFAGVMVYLDQVLKTNVSKGVQYYNATGLTSAKNYTISTKTVDSTGNINQTPVDNTSTTASYLDIEPPAGVTNLKNVSYAPTYINWKWTDPEDADFAGVMVYLDHVFKTNVSKGVQYYNATGLTPVTNYTISTKTVDNAGNINQTSVDNISTTAPPLEPITITIISPANKSINTTGDVNVTVLLDRAGTALLNWNGVNESMNGADKNFYKLQEDLLSGNFNFKVYAIDSKGVSNVSETRTLTVNRTKIINLSIDPETGNVSKKIISIAPSGNVTLTIFNGINVSGCDKVVTNISIDSPDQLNSTLEKKLGTGEIFLQENFSALPNCSRFNPDIQLQFNYTDEQLEAAKIDDERNVAVKFYNTTTSKWEVLELYERNESGSINYIIVNVSHFSIISLIGQVPSPTPPRGGGGGGGGVGTSGEAFDNILISETEREYVNRDSKVIYSFDMEGNIVQHINFTGVKNSGEVAARVEILKNTSTLVENPPPDVIYKNLNIWVGNVGWATSKNIVEPTINFRVEKFWVSENNIDESTIRLIRYTDGTWNPLITSKIYEDADNLYFEGETTEFSPFAVSGKNIPAKPGGLGEEASVEESSVQTSTEKEPGMPGFSLLICLMSLLIGAYILQKK